MKLEDAIYNWLQIRVVVGVRPDDRSAVDTMDFFFEMIRDDHHVSDLTYQTENGMYMVQYLRAGEAQTLRFDAEAIESLLDAINSEPKYQQ